MKSQQDVISDFHPIEKGCLYYEIKGMGDPLVFIHTSGLDHRMWDKQWDFFTQFHRVLRYDFRSLGRSVSEPGRYFYHHDLASLLETTIRQPVHLVGQASGAAMAIDFAIEFPQLTQSLVLVSPSLGGNPYNVFTSQEKAFLLHLPQNEKNAMIDFMLRKWLDGPRRSPADMPEVQRKHVMAIYRDTFAHNNHPLAFPLITTPPTIDRLQEIYTPTLILSGAYDMDGMLAMAVLLTEKIYGASRVLLPSVGHLINIEIPDKFNQLVTEFIESNSAKYKSQN